MGSQRVRHNWPTFTSNSALNSLFYLSPGTHHQIKWFHSIWRHIKAIWLSLRIKIWLRLKPWEFMPQGTLRLSPRTLWVHPLQCSCLENPKDGGAWWAAVYGSHRVAHDWSDLACSKLSPDPIWSSEIKIPVCWARHLGFVAALNNKKNGF